MKKSYRLSEVCRLLDLQPYVLRYWITEFPRLGEGAGGSVGQRAFSAREVALLRRIKVLLYEEGYTIAGARKKLESDPAADGGDVSAELFAQQADELAGEETAAPVLDTAADERIETLRQGIAAALDEARAILSLLDSSK